MRERVRSYTPNIRVLSEQLYATIRGFGVKGTWTAAYLVRNCTRLWCESPIKNNCKVLCKTTDKKQNYLGLNCVKDVQFPFATYRAGFRPI